MVKSPGIPDNIDIIKKDQETRDQHHFRDRICRQIYCMRRRFALLEAMVKQLQLCLHYHILKKAGLNVGLAGNVGQSFAMQVATNDYDYYVIEISSFQLDGMFDFKADIAVLMNITPDHLDRYDNDFQKYIDSKFRIIQNQTQNDAFIYCADDPEIKRRLRSDQYTRHNNILFQ